MRADTPHAQVLLLAAIQGSGRYVCPKCQGGTLSERSLYLCVSPTGAPGWLCFRASCGFSGGNPAGATSAVVRQEPRHYTRPYKPLTEQQKRLIEQRFGLPATSVDGYSESNDRFVLPVFGPVGYQKRGIIAYSLSGDTPKSLNYKELTDLPFIHYSIPSQGKLPLVIVEDWFSAEKVAATHAAIGVSIMGTHLGVSHIEEISALAMERASSCVIALDQDAYAKSINYVARYREQFPNGLSVWHLNTDLKYESIERIKAALDGKTNLSGTH